jgi:AAA ATPase domain
MKLKQFRVRGFRCIHDTGVVKVADTAALIGKNESGKTAILEALAHLNKDLPFSDEDICDELVDRLGGDDRIVEAEFELSEADRSLAARELPGATVESVTIFRTKSGKETDYDFPGAKFAKKHSTITGNESTFKEAVQLVGPTLPLPLSNAFQSEPAAEREGKRAELKARLEALLNRLLSFETFEFRKTEPPFKELSQLVGKHFRSSKAATNAIENVRKAYRALFVLADYPGRAKTFVKDHLHPRVLYFPEYKVIDGIIDLNQYLQAKDAPRSRTDVGYQFQKAETVRNLFHLAQLDPKQLDAIAANPPRLRSELVRSSRRLTEMLALTWKAKKIDVRLDFSNGIVTVEVADIYPDGVSKNRGLLDRRSSGFKWHFSFFVNFRAGIRQTAFKDAILLLDEPGLNLHPEQQAGLVEVIRELSETNQILYTTHSPFMIYNFETGSLLTVEFDAETKASRIRTNFWEGDWQTIRPILHSIGDTMLLKVFKGAEALPAIVAVEGITDQRYLVTLAEFEAEDVTSSKLCGAEPFPSGGNAAVKERALHYHKRKRTVVAFFDSEPEANEAAKQLEHRGFPANAIVRVNVGKDLADIEDLFTREDYLLAVNGLYSMRLRDAKDFKGISKRDLQRIEEESGDARIVKLLEKLFGKHQDDSWGRFDKVAVCNYMCERIITGELKLSRKSIERFDDIFTAIRAAVDYWEQARKPQKAK